MPVSYTHLDVYKRQVADRLTQLLGKQVVFAASDRVVDENVQQAAAALSLIHISTTAKRDMMHRYNSLYLGKFEEMDIVGYKSQFTQSYRMPDAAAVYPDVKAAWETTRGPGLNPDMTGEGLRVNNFIATYVIGPILVLNPPLAKWFLRKMGMSDPKLAFEAVSYTHLDVYKRQEQGQQCPGKSARQGAEILAEDQRLSLIHISAF